MCTFPFFVCVETNKHVLMLGSDKESKKNDAVNVINECQRKFKFFMGHRARCTNQKLAITEIKKQMQVDCMTKRKGFKAIMIKDFKMKLEAMSSRETTLDHYGKRGVSWHGFCLIFYLCKTVPGDNNETVEEPVRYTVHLNQLLSDSNK